MIEVIKRHIVIIVVALIVVVSLFVINTDKSYDAQIEPDFEQQIELLEEEVELDESETILIVDIKGEVKRPGVYEMAVDARVTDVISIAGGFTSLADERQINLAQKVQDEMVIIVPKEGEESEIAPILNAPISDQEGGKIHINRATKEEIESLNGIGPKKAQAILDYLEENGPFQSIEDLTNVSGIGEKTLENLKDSIVIP